MRLCKNCGYDLTESGAFCPECGAPNPIDNLEDEVLQEVDTSVDNNQPAPVPAPVAAPVPVPVRVADLEPAASVMPDMVPNMVQQAMQPEVLPVQQVVQPEVQPMTATVPQQPIVPPMAQPVPVTPNMMGGNIIRDFEYISSTGAQGFVSPDEYLVFSLKNGVGLNLLSGEGWQTEDAVLTNMRLYYNNNSGFFNVSKLEAIIDLDDLTCAKFNDEKPFRFIIFAVIMFAFFFWMYTDDGNSTYIIFGAVLAAISALLYYFLKKSYFELCFPGGHIKFSVKDYGIQQIREFQRGIFSAKAKLIEDRKKSK